MKDQLKKLARWILIKLQIPLTKNIEYDILTEKVLTSVLNKNSNCADVGAHKGEILDIFLRCAPNGRHIAFEPIPYLYQNLIDNYGKRVSVYPYALASMSGQTEFNLVLDDPAYSGIKQRAYKTANARVEKIQVEVRSLDEVVKEHNLKIDLIKIDVEGGEFDVLKGASHILTNDKPVLIFECGRGASEFYGTQPGTLFDFLSSYGYQLYTLKTFLKRNTSITRDEFEKFFETGNEYYFVGTA